MPDGRGCSPVYSAIARRSAMAARQRSRCGCSSPGLTRTTRAKSTATTAVMSAMLKPAPAIVSRPARRVFRPSNSTRQFQQRNGFKAGRRLLLRELSREMNPGVRAAWDAMDRVKQALLTSCVCA